MFAIIGATGAVGRATCEILRAAAAPVRAIVHNPAKGIVLEEAGCEIVSADLQEREALAQAIAGASAVQIIVPLRPQVEYPAADMQCSIASIAAALAQARPRRVLAISDYGAHVDRDIGMPSIFRELERRLRELGGETMILRSAEHMHNWVRSIPAALASGTLQTFQSPVDMVQPTIAAQDLGCIAAELLLREKANEGVEIIHAEGPQRYSANDVAQALGRLAGRSVKAQTIPREEWKASLSHGAASLTDLLIKANAAKNQGGLVDIEPGIGEVRCGTTELTDALRMLVPTP